MGASADDLEYEAAMEVEEDLALDDRRLSLAFNLPRHLEEIKGTDVETQSWRMRERMKTVSDDLHIFCLIGKRGIILSVPVSLQTLFISEHVLFKLELKSSKSYFPT